MEIGDDADGDDKKTPVVADGGGSSSGGGAAVAGSGGGSVERPTKRMMKSPYQLEVLEQTYAREQYPSESVRAELSAKIGLSDRQLQMWFCHRRLKERKVQPGSGKRARKEEEQMPVIAPPPVLPPPASHDALVGPGSIPVPVRGAHRAASAVPRLGPQHYYEPPMISPPMPARMPLTDAGLRAIRYVERQLGEPLRSDGPMLGTDFDPLPPGAFGAPIEQQKPPVRPYEGKLFARHDTKTIKTSAYLPSMETPPLGPSSYGGSKRKSGSSSSHGVHSQPRAPQEYQFLPEQPTAIHEAYERGPPRAHIFDSPVQGPGGSPYLHSNESTGPSYTFQGHLSSSGVVLTPPTRAQVFSTPVSVDYDVAHAGSSSYARTVSEGPLLVTPASGSESSYLAGLSDSRRIEEEASRADRKRKHEESKIAKEVEAHEKKIRREMEKQDMLRRKREEQLRREMERQTRERRKEEERQLREKQREEERFQREQRKEIERREKLFQKESRKAEKQKQKEEMRREKEAARQKAATERATARRIAKEYMELIEDERLELMELAAHTKGFPSMLALDTETLNDLDSFRKLLTKFPPDSVKLKRPFATLPWIHSEDNVGNLLMVWKFLMTFADVLGLWPFSLDEFVQDLHDSESRRLGEVHVSILRLILKDIEEVARMPAVVSGANQSSAVNPGGGHLQIVEMALLWGFNIRNWQRHLNYVTWPEVLRQVAIAAGFGPKFKKKNVEDFYYRDDNDGQDGENVISTLRDGSAAEHAVALMRERGYSHRRKRHRLTPGTVKFAAFHVLSLEGSHGLTILEVADKIQKSGLRDLTTSKTPEASIAAALSRDTKLFERTAPSTYCVRTPYRKDPETAEEVLSTALEKIKAFQNATKDAEDRDDGAEAEAEADGDGDGDGDAEADADADADGDDVERDEDSDCVDDADEPEGNGVNTGSKSGNGDALISDANNTDTAPLASPLESAKGSEVVSGEKSNIATCASSSLPTQVAPNGHGDVGTGGREEFEIDESIPVEPWVQGLDEGDYGYLTVEERLNALVALIGIALRGNSIRNILEERLEAANALKKQMWAEAQLDKRRLREEYATKIQFSPFSGVKQEEGQANNSMPTEDNLAIPICNNVDTFVAVPNHGPSNPDELCNISTERSGGVLQDTSQNLDALAMHQYGHAEKTRSQMKAYIAYKAEQLHVYRSLPLGQDRRRNRYWQFSTSASPCDPGTGRIFFESRESQWRVIDSEEAFDSLMASLDTRGIREANLHSMLQRIEPTFKQANRIWRETINESIKTELGKGIDSSPNSSSYFDSPTSSIISGSSDALDTAQVSDSFRIQIGRTNTERLEISKRYEEYVKWLWAECCNAHVLCAMQYGKKRCSELLKACEICCRTYLAEDNHCPSCHKEFKAHISLSEHLLECEEKMRDAKIEVVVPNKLTIGMELLKAYLALVEVSLPAEALKDNWNDLRRKSWALELKNASSPEDVFQMLTLLEKSVHEDYLSSNFETTAELLEAAGVPNGPYAVIPSVPNTAAAVAFRLFYFDASIFYMPLQKIDSQKNRDDNGFMNLPSRYSVVKNVSEFDRAPSLDPLDGSRWLDPMASGRRGRGRGRGRGAITGGRGRGRGGRPPKLPAGPSRTAEDTDRNPYLKPKRSYTRRGGRPRGASSNSTARGRRRGRRSTRPRQGGRAGAIPKESLLGSFNIINNSNNKTDTAVEDVSRSSGEEEELKWGQRLSGVEAISRSSGEEEELNWEQRLSGVEAEDNSSDENEEENGEMLADEYVDRMPHQYAGQYMPGETMDENEEEEEDGDNDDDDEDADAEGYDDGLHYSHAREDDGVEMMDEDGDDDSDGGGGGDDNVDDDDEDDGGDDGYSEYSD
ncbi:Homeodomain-like transcriptional regulator [Rhynchospora pubera]|uniref:Homeodomain-like transcriptional regulator n=1 Tax=Rhynchospora pubera TaxID=906938 RepID=A0AAV8C403_9POAL|nr:Homeodomain-like transcriptional regulator [Rhynchospora pubera]